MEILSEIEDLSAPFSDNQAEREIRMVRLQQKISQTFRSEQGFFCFCRIRGYIPRVKNNKQSHLTSLVETFGENLFLPKIAHRST